jgi:hypothetical protein
MHSLIRGEYKEVLFSEELSSLPLVRGGLGWGKNDWLQDLIDRY